MLAADHPVRIDAFTVRDARTGEIATSGTPHYAGQVSDWGGRHYWTADFSSLTAEGEYVLHAGSEHRPDQPSTRYSAFFFPHTTAAQRLTDSGYAGLKDLFTETP